MSELYVYLGMIVSMLCYVKQPVVSAVETLPAKRLVIDYRWEDGRFPVSASCVKISATYWLNCSEIWANLGKEAKKPLSYQV
jgi:hypothetical protein